MENFTTFKKLPDLQEAKALEQLLHDNGVEIRFVDNSSSLDTSLGGGLAKEYEIQVKHDDFTKAEAVLINRAKEQLGVIPESHYLLEFTDEELYDVVLKHDEWSDYDYLLARKLLEERGKAIDDELMKSLRQQRLADLAKPEDKQTPWIVFGYIAAFVGGIFGIITGYVLWTSRKTLPNGDIVYKYREGDRQQGKIIMILGIIMLPVWFIIKMISEK